MKIKQLNKVKNPIFTYKFDLEFMFGDGDYYDYDIVLIKADDPNLERFINFLDNSVRFDMNYEDKPVDYDLFCNEEFADEDSIFFWWPCDEYQLARLEKYKVTFFDGYGVEYNVEISK